MLQALERFQFRGPFRRFAIFMGALIASASGMRWSITFASTCTTVPYGTSLSARR